MITEIRLMTRQGAATTVRYDGTFQGFVQHITQAMIDSNHNRAQINFASFPTFLINLNELAFATAYERADEPEPKKE